MAEELRISGKDLGALARLDCCARCSWVKIKLGRNLPFQVFPGIFASIDSYTKHVVHTWFDDHGCAPPWLSCLGNVTGYIDPPHSSKFFMHDQNLNVRLTGAADGIFRCADGSCLIVDYKTARFTDKQDEMLPVYETQLNAYALISEATGLGTVSGLALIYMEPCTTPTDARLAEHRHQNGFGMRFSATVKPIELRRDSIPPLLQEARRLFDLPKPPARSAKCKDCRYTEELIDAASSKT